MRPLNLRGRHTVRATAILALAVLHCPLVWGAHESVGLVTGLIDIRHGSIGMGELYLGMTRGEVERVLHRYTPVREDAQPACGQYASTVILGGVKVEIQWSDNTPARTVDSLYTVLVRPESIASATDGRSTRTLVAVAHVRQVGCFTYSGVLLQC
jgi:hypothetical protein